MRPCAAKIAAMEKQDLFEVTVRRDLEDLVPAFVENRHKEVAALEAALVASDLEELRRIAAMMQAVGESFGIARIRELGADIEDAAGRSDFDGVAVYMAIYRHYLNRLRIRIEPAA